jgi:RNA ligase
MNLPSIPKIYALGQRHNVNIFEDLVQVQEKIDGSQFSFGAVDGKLECRSKGQTIDPNDPGMFKLAVESAQRAFAILLQHGTIKEFEGGRFQCEFLAKPRHNLLAYSRVPAGNLVLFDVVNTKGEYASDDQRREFAKDLGLEAVKVFYTGFLPATTHFQSFGEYFEKESQLGGVKIEGVVVKNYSKPHPESSSGLAPMTAKIVAPSFKEKRATVPSNPGKAGAAKDIVEKLTNCLRTEARWLKAIQHLREAGQLSNENKDIGPLCKEIQADIIAEETDWIKERLFEEFSKEILNGTVRGFAQFYQKFLANGPSVYQEFIAEKQAQ